MGKETSSSDVKAPKRPMSGYICFVQVIREEHRKMHPNDTIVFKEFTKKCADKWNNMKDDEKKRFLDMAEKDRERYTKEMNEFTKKGGVVTGAKGKKRKMAKDPNKPKRALSAFFFFSNEKRGQIKDKHPDWRVGDIAKELGRLWEGCSDRSAYDKMAAEDKKRYASDMAAYQKGASSSSAKQSKKSKGTSNGDDLLEDEDDDDFSDDEDIADNGE